MAGWRAIVRPWRSVDEAGALPAGAPEVAGALGSAGGGGFACSRPASNAPSPCAAGAGLGQAFLALRHLCLSGDCAEPLRDRRAAAVLVAGGPTRTRCWRCSTRRGHDGTVATAADRRRRAVPVAVDTAYSYRVPEGLARPPATSSSCRSGAAPDGRPVRSGRAGRRAATT